MTGRRGPAKRPTRCGPKVVVGKVEVVVAAKVGQDAVPVAPARRIVPVARVVSKVANAANRAVSAAVNKAGR